MKNEQSSLRIVFGLALIVLCWRGRYALHAQTITPHPYWKSQLVLPIGAQDRFPSFQTAGLRWVKFTILTAPYDPNVVYYQHTGRIALHHQFATNYLDPFKGISAQDYYQAVLVDENPPAALGTVLIPSGHINEYAIQFVRYDREAIRDYFFTVQQSITAPDGVQAFLFPTFEQEDAAEADRDWFAAQGITVGSSNRWAEGNICYAEGWALGTLKFVPSEQIVDAYQTGELTVQDILLTDGVPAEIPATAGVISLAPSTPNSHVAILSRTYGTPFLYLALQEDANLAQELIGRRVLLSAYEDGSGSSDTLLLDTDLILDDDLASDILARKIPEPLNIQPIAPYGAYGSSTENLSPADTCFFGGKASHFGILRQAIPDNSPRAIALSFDLWSRFLDQPLTPSPVMSLAPGAHLIVWADDDPSQGPTHTNFKLSRGGETLALIGRDGITVLDVVDFNAQTQDISYGRSVDGGDAWQYHIKPTPGQANADSFAPPPLGERGLVINEFMADNKKTLEDPNERGEYPDWIELYNGTDRTIELNGLYLTDDLNEPTKWQFPVAISADNLRKEIAHRLAPYQSYPPSNIQALWEELATIRNLFRQPTVTAFDSDLQNDLLDLLTASDIGYAPHTRLRFRSSTNVEDSEDYTGAGLYDSYSGCPADDLDSENQGPSHCDPNKTSERGVFRAMRRTMAGFYNDNAYLERIRRSVPETDVGMAMVVHPSFPDEFELANGVATVTVKPEEGTWTCTLVTQKGATSVTNPIDGSTPEEVVVIAQADRSLFVPNTSGNLTPLRSNSVNGIKAYSTLVPLGATVMDWADDYSALVTLLLDVSDRYAIVTDKTAYTLDLEYKKVAPGDQNLPNGGLVVKQVRQVPEPDAAAMVTPYLVGGPATYEIFTGEFGEAQSDIDVFANHRLKSLWQLTPENMLLDSNNLDLSLYTNIQVEQIEENSHPHTRDIFADLYSFQDNTVTQQWQLTELSNPRTYQLTIAEIPTEVAANTRPFFTLNDLGTAAYTPVRVFALKVNYESPVRAWTKAGLNTTFQNTVHLAPRLDVHDEDLLMEHTGTQDGITVSTRYYRPAPQRFGIPTWGLNSTAPITGFDQTTIQGLTTEPIVLTDYYAQTYRPEHHNLAEHLLFEPQLEPTLSQTQLDELRTRNVRFIHLIVNHEAPESAKYAIRTYTFE